jgi:hypothetical protein
MSWLPIGPDFVFAPRRSDFKRLSVRNELGRQGLVSGITVDPSDPGTVYAIVRPSSGGTSAFRSRSAGAGWDPIADVLQQGDPAIDPSCVVVNPAHPATVYLATGSDSGLYVSADRGDTWGQKNPVGGYVRTLLADPSTAATPGSTVLLAGTSAGVYHSADGGSTWTQVLAGDVWSLAADFTPGAQHFFAGAYAAGVFYATGPAGPWTNLDTAGIGLPPHAAPTASAPQGNFNAILLDRCPANSRVYALFATENSDGSMVFADLYTSASPLTSWTSVPVASPPEPAYGFYDFSFSVAPNSPGDGLADIMFFGSVGLFRSTDGGRTWAGDGSGFHADQHAYAFSPAIPPAGTVPVMYLGCDGGIAMSDKFADPGFAFAATPSDVDEGLDYVDSGVPQNLNHAMQSSAVYQYAGSAAVPAASYIGCQDTGVNAGTGALGWRGIADADAGAIAAGPGPDGVSVWGVLGAFNGWPGFRAFRWADDGSLTPPAAAITLNPGGSLLATTSNYVVGLDGNCLAGAVTRDPLTTLPAAITAAGVQTVTPASASGISAGLQLVVNSGAADAETITVTAATAATFTASFAKTHAAGAALTVERSAVARLDHANSATRISQVFGTSAVVVSVAAASPVDPNAAWCATNDQRVWFTNALTGAGSGTTWTEAAAGRPSSLSISSLAVDTAGDAWVLLGQSITTGGGEFTVTSPLFKVTGGTWVQQDCAALPTGFGYGKLVADPATAGILYASSGARVYQLTLSGSVWTWTDISDGLPGQWIYDLWSGQVGGGAAARRLLRAAIPTRAAWELDLATLSAAPPAAALYVRKNSLDLGWVLTAADGAANPYRPGEQVWHYQCADIKVDSRQSGGPSGADFFQTDPEGATLPISHVLFDQLRDNSQALPAGDSALVHAQVHNHSANPANQVHVWAIECNASAGVPALSASPSQGNGFDFWGQFSPSGQIIPALPADSPWRPIGPPQIVSGADAAHPQVASWNWTVPNLGSGDPGHHCVALFLHSAVSPVGEHSYNLDDIAARNPQVGQKNLHIGPPLPPSPHPRGGPGPSGQPFRPYRQYVEFHNPTASPRAVDLVFDLRRLPAGIRTVLGFSELATSQPLASALSGIAHVLPPAGLTGEIERGLHEIAEAIDRAEDFVENHLRRVFGLAPEHDADDDDVKFPIPLTPVRYEAKRSSTVEVRGVQLGPYGTVSAYLELTTAGQLDAGGAYRFEIQQVAGGQVAGGCTYVVPIGGTAALPTTIVADSQRTDLDPELLEQIERAAEPLRYLPPWAEDLVAQRGQEQGRDGA